MSLVSALRRDRGFALIAIATLAMGLGACTAVFTLTDSVLLRPLNYPHPSQLISIHESILEFAQQYPVIPVNAASFAAWRERSQTLESLALVEPDTFDLTGAGQPQQVVVDSVSASMLHVLQVAPRLGRDFTAAEDQPQKNHVVILTDGFWRSRFHGDPGVLGHTLDLNGRPNEVIGVLPADFRFPQGEEFGPMVAGNASGPVQMLRPIGLDLVHPEMGSWNYGVFARLRPGATLTQAGAELQGITAVMLTAGKAPIQRVNIVVTPLRDQIVGASAFGLWLLLAAVGAILLIVCLNLANLMLVRMQARSHELAIRLALGIRRSRLLREAMGEGVMLALGGGAMGLMLAWWAVRGVVRLAPAALPRLAEVGLHPEVVLFALMLAAGSGALFSLGAAWRAARTDPQTALRAGGRGLSEGRERLRARSWLIAAQSALAALLLIVAGLLASSYWHLSNVPTGFDPGHVQTAQAEWAAGSRTQRNRFYTAALEKLAALPGVRSVGLVSRLPLQASGDTSVLAMPHDTRPMSERPLAQRRSASAGYFAAMGIPLLRGRVFTDADLAAAGERRGLTPAIISARMASQLWPGRDPLGQQFGWNDNGNPQDTVIGVVGDIRSRDLSLAPEFTVYQPYTLNGDTPVEFVVRGSTSAPAAATVRQTLWRVQPAVAIPQVESMDAVVAASTAARRFQLWLVLGFAVCALLLAALGIYGILAYAVQRRAAEIGIRITLGARASSLIGMVLRQGLTPVLAGLLAGVGASLAAGKLLTSLLFGVQPADPLVIAGVSVLLLIVAALACALPARRATRVSPVSVLRS
ncbi:MAG TPA: ABC transporter permease [Terriglobales bacterium]|jgi:predicted permease